MSLFVSSAANTVTKLFKKRNREQKNLNRLKNMTKTEYKDINEAPEVNNFIFSVLLNTPNIQQNGFNG